MSEESRGEVLAEFSASLPEIQSAVSIGRDGCRLKLDIPASEAAEYHKLAAFGFDKELVVRIHEA